MRRRHHTRAAGAAALAGLLAVLAGCAGAGSPAAAPTSSGTARPSASDTNATQGAEVVASDRDNGRTVSLVIGQRLRVVLQSTYWTFQQSSNPRVLTSDGAPTVNPQPSGCVPGQGCGSATASFTAVGSGRALVSAARKSCGEALACTGSRGEFVVHVIVGSG